MKINVMGPNAERRGGLKTLLRRVTRQAQFHEAPEWPYRHETQGHGDKPDMIVIDWTPGMRVIELQSLLSAMPGVPAAVVVDRPSASQVFMLLAAGAMGIIPRALDPILVLRAFEMVMLGGHYIPPEIFDAGHGRESVLRRAQDKATLLRRLRKDLSLSPRQQQIMRCVHMGSTNKMIARMLGISEGTVKIHLTGIFQQLGATNRAAAVAIYNGVQATHLEVLNSGAVDVDQCEAERGEVEAESNNDAPTAATEREDELAATAVTHGEIPDDQPTPNHPDASEPVQPTETNVVPLPTKQSHYPSPTSHGSTPFPMAAEPESPF
jgi:DNA-binding NarL/FixJ family response regulator